MKENGGQAFPYDKLSDGIGMSLRDWFAGQSLIFSIEKWGEYNPQYVAREAYAVADAMIKERGK